MTATTHDLILGIQAEVDELMAQQDALGVKIDDLMELEERLEEKMQREYEKDQE